MIGIGLAWLAIFGASNGSAATTQWFPADKTSIEYTLSSYLTWNNGTADKSTSFTIYNATPYILFCPTKLDQVTAHIPSWTIIKSGATVKMRHVYADANSTTLYRSTIFLVDNLTFANNDWMGMLLAQSSISYTWVTMRSYVNQTYQKSNFVVPILYDTMDYFDNSVGPGMITTDDFSIIAMTSDRIIALQMAGADTNLTYVAEMNGKITSYSHVSKFGLSSVPNLHCSTFILETPPIMGSGIPGFPVEWILMISSAGIIFLVMMARKRKTL